MTRPVVRPQASNGDAGRSDIAVTALPWTVPMAVVETMIVFGSFVTLWHHDHHFSLVHSVKVFRLESSTGRMTGVADQTCKICHGGRQADPALLALRPHHVRLSSPDKAGNRGQIRFAASLGKEIQHMVESAVGRLFVISHVVDNLFAQDESVSVQFNTDHARWVAV